MVSVDKIANSDVVEKLGTTTNNNLWPSISCLSSLNSSPTVQITSKTNIVKTNFRVQMKSPGIESITRLSPSWKGILGIMSGHIGAQ